VYIRGISAFLPRPWDDPVRKLKNKKLNKRAVRKENFFIVFKEWKHSFHLLDSLLIITFED
jgi:hypothetical protein